ncbi:DJ-1/PfpI family protein [Nocardiopsis coralliicola]
MDIAFALYPGMTALDFAGPHEVLTHLPSVTSHYVAASAGEVECDSGLKVRAEEDFAAVPRPDVVVVPGSGQFEAVLEREAALIEWLAAVHPAATWTTSVCTGSTLLAAAGILRDRPATTHWGARQLLAGQGVRVVTDRVVVVGDVITAAGVSAGLDMALTLADRLWGEQTARALQLFLEYAPEPPFDSGSLETADPAVVDHLLGALSD